MTDRVQGPGVLLPVHREEVRQAHQLLARAHRLLGADQAQGPRRPAQGRLRPRPRTRHRSRRLRPGPAQRRGRSLTQHRAAVSPVQLRRHRRATEGSVMRKIISGMFITLDGVVEAPQKWNPPYYDGEMTQAVMGQIAAAGTHLYGRRSYDLFRSVFTGPAAARIPHAQMMTSAPKVVVSATRAAVASRTPGRHSGHPNARAVGCLRHSATRLSRICPCRLSARIVGPGEHARRHEPETAP
jgi:hypothetical protein